MNAAGLSHIGSNSFASAVFWFVFFSLGLERWGGAEGCEGVQGWGRGLDQPVRARALARAP